MDENEENIEEEEADEEILDEDECEDCGGTGEVTTMEYVYPGEPHMAPIGTRTCHCRIREPEYEPEQ